MPLSKESIIHYCDQKTIHIHIQGVKVNCLYIATYSRRNSQHLIKIDVIDKITNNCHNTILTCQHKQNQTPHIELLSATGKQRLVGRCLCLSHRFFLGPVPSVHLCQSTVYATQLTSLSLPINHTLAHCGIRTLQCQRPRAYEKNQTLGESCPSRGHVVLPQRPCPVHNNYSFMARNVKYESQQFPSVMKT